MQSEGFLQRGEGKSSCAEPSKTGPELFTGEAAVPARRAANSFI